MSENRPAVPQDRPSKAEDVLPVASVGDVLPKAQAGWQGGRNAWPPQEF